MFGDNCVVPAKIKVSPAKPGALPLAQSALSLQLPEPPPFHVSVDALTASETEADALNEFASVTLTPMETLPVACEAGTVAVQE
jgi:P pilus assembly chaperone PapD